jgi:hypothetical protein
MFLQHLETPEWNWFDDDDDDYDYDYDYIDDVIDDVIDPLLLLQSYRWGETQRFNSRHA